MNKNYWTANEKKSMKAFKKDIKILSSAFIKYRGPISADQFYKESEKEYRKLLPVLPFHAGSPTMIFNKLMPTLGVIVAAWRVLSRHGYTVEQFGRIELEGYMAYFNKIPGFLKRMENKTMITSKFSEKMNRTCAAMNESQDRETFFLNYSFDETHGPRTSMKCSQCAMITFMKEQGNEELYRICNVFDYAQAFSFGFGMVQPSCIGKGDKVCQYIFTGNPADTVLPDNIRRIMNTNMKIG